MKSVPLAIVCLAITMGCGEESPSNRSLHQNVVLVVVDSLRPDHLSSYRYDRPSTSALDRLADEGARFEAAFAPSSSPIPSLVSIHTSLPPEQHGVVSEAFALDENALTLAEVLAENGFETAAFVTGPGSSKARGLAQGFGTYVEQTATGGDEGTVMATARKWLDADHASPFFLYVQLELSDVSSSETYDTSVQSVDHEIGDLLENLDGSGLARETLVIVTASRGHDFERSHGDPLSLRNESVQVPMLFRLPSKIEAGKVISQRARLMDIGSTILMFARITLPLDFGFVHAAHAFSMRDLAEMLIGEPRDFDVVVPGELEDHSQSFRQDEYKIIRFLPNADRDPALGEYELFNLDLDPLERHNIYEQEERRGELLARKMMAWREICARRPRFAVPYGEEHD